MAVRILSGLSLPVVRVLIQDTIDLLVWPEMCFGTSCFGVGQF